MMPPRTEVACTYESVSDCARWLEERHTTAERAIRDATLSQLIAPLFERTSGGLVRIEPRCEDIANTNYGVLRLMGIPAARAAALAHLFTGTGSVAVHADLLAVGSRETELYELPADAPARKLVRGSAGSYVPGEQQMHVDAGLRRVSVFSDSQLWVYELKEIGSSRWERSPLPG